MSLMYTNLSASFLNPVNLSVVAGPFDAFVTAQGVSKRNRVGQGQCTFLIADENSEVLQYLNSNYICHVQVTDEVMNQSVITSPYADRTVAFFRINKVDSNDSADGLEYVVSGPDLVYELVKKIVPAGTVISDGSEGKATDDIEQLMAYRPAGWSFDAGVSTTEGTYLTSEGETLLDMLLYAVEQSGEGFRLRARDERYFKWLQTPDDSQVTLGQFNAELGAHGPGVGYIIQISEETDKYEIATRLYIAGGGSGDDVFGIADASGSYTPPAGFSVDYTNGIITNTALEASLGEVIEVYKKFGNIKPENDGASAKVTAAVQLIEAGIQHLQSMETGKQFYRVNCILHGEVLAGQTVELNYHNYIGLDPDDLRHRWALDNGDYTDSAGSIDLSEGGNVGNVTGLIDDGDAAAFNGVDNYLYTGDEPTLQLTTDTTVYAWFKMASYPSSTREWFNNSYAGGGWLARVTPAGRLQFVFFSAASTFYTVNSDPSIGLDQWHMFAFTYDHSARTVRTYLNGRLIDTTVMSGPMYYGGGPRMGVGARYNGNQAMACDVDEIVFADGVANDNVIQKLYRGGLGRLWGKTFQKLTGDYIVHEITITLTRDGDLVYDLLVSLNNLMPRTGASLVIGKIKDIQRDQRHASSPAGSLPPSGAVYDHGALDGLLDDDHTQYLRADGLRPLAGNLAVNASVTIDGVDISAHAAAADAHHTWPLTEPDIPSEIARTPLTLNVSTTNVNGASGHTHTITSSSNPGSSASLLSTDAGGQLQIRDLNIGRWIGFQQAGTDSEPSLYGSTVRVHATASIQAKATNSFVWMDTSLVEHMTLDMSTGHLLVGDGGTDTAVVNIFNSATPSLKLQATSQAWVVRQNGTQFQVLNETSGIVPLRIVTSAPVDSVYVGSAGVGIHGVSTSDFTIGSINGYNHDIDFIIDTDKPRIRMRDSSNDMWDLYMQDKTFTMTLIGSGGAEFVIDSSADDFAQTTVQIGDSVFLDSSGTSYFAGGSLAVNKTSATETLDVNGGILADGNIKAVLDGVNWIGFASTQSIISDGANMIVRSGANVVVTIDSNNDDADTRYFDIRKNSGGATGDFIARFTEGGRVGIGTSVPDAPIHVLTSGSPVSSLDNEALGAFQKSGLVSDNAYVYVVSGTSAIAGVRLGDSSDPIGGQLVYDNSDDSLSMGIVGVASGKNLSLDSNGRVTVTAPTTNQFTVAYDGTYFMSFDVSATGEVVLNGPADLTFDLDGRDILPSQHYSHNLGLPTRKYLSLAAAELIVTTLVAENVLSTIGGRIIVASTSELTADVADTDTTIDVKHNDFSSGDIVLLEAPSGGSAQVEFMSIDSAATGTGPYTYTVTRNLDGTGANNWLAGDAVVNTGQAGSGFIDIYSQSGILSGNGPTLVGNVRNSSTYNDWSATWAIGNLNGVYGYALETYGVGLGKYATGSNHITIDPDNGFRIYAGTSEVISKWDGSVITLGPDSDAQAVISPSSWQLIDENDNVKLLMDDTQIRVGESTQAHTVISPTTITLNDSNGDDRLQLSAGSIRVGKSTEQRVQIDTTNGIRFFDSSSNQVAKWLGTTITLGITSDNYLELSTGNGIRFFDNVGSVLGQFNNSQITLGESGHLRTEIQNAQIRMYDTSSNIIAEWSNSEITLGKSSDEQLKLSNSKGIEMLDSFGDTVAQWSGSTVTIGNTGSEHVEITSTAVSLKNNTTSRIVMQGDGDVFIGSNTSSPSSTYFSLFANSQTYNSESMGAGDLLIGDNSSSKPNIRYDSSASQLQFRGGSTTKSYIDSNGRFVAGGGDVIVDDNGIYIAGGSGFVTPAQSKYLNLGGRGQVFGFAVGSQVGAIIETANSKSKLHLVEPLLGDSEIQIVSDALYRYDSGGTLIGQGGIYVPDYHEGTGWQPKTLSDVTTATALDLTSWGVPDEAVAVQLAIIVNDSATWGTASLYFSVGTSSNPFMLSCRPAGGDVQAEVHGIVPLSSGANIYYRSNASGTNTLDVYLRVMGYFV